MQNAIGKLSTGAETIKEEPIEIVVVKVTGRLIFKLQAWLRYFFEKIQWGAGGDQLMTFLSDVWYESYHEWSDFMILNLRERSRTTASKHFQRFLYILEREKTRVQKVTSVHFVSFRTVIHIKQQMSDFISCFVKLSTL